MLDVSKTRNKPEERPWYSPALKLISKARGTTVLDVGSGLGEFATKLRKKGFKVSCVDGSTTYVKKLRKRGFQAKQADFNNKLPYASNSFDIITCLEVIEHIENAELLLKEMRRILKKDGYLILSTPNYAYILVRLQMLLGRAIPDEGYHFRFFTYKTLVRLIRKMKLEIVTDWNISFLPWYRITKTKPVSIRVKFLRNILASKIIILAKK